MDKKVLTTLRYFFAKQQTGPIWFILPRLHEDKIQELFKDYSGALLIFKNYIQLHWGIIIQRMHQI